MNRFVWKYDISDSRFTKLVLPENAKILSCGLQDNEPVIWVHVDDQLEANNTCEVLRVKTGFDYIPEDQGWSFLGTLIYGTGEFIEHVFYRVGGAS